MQAASNPREPEFCLLRMEGVGKRRRGRENPFWFFLRHNNKHKLFLMTYPKRSRVKIVFCRIIQVVHKRKWTYVYRHMHTCRRVAIS